MHELSDRQPSVSAAISLWTLSLLLVACGNAESGQDATGAEFHGTVFEGARLIDGNGGPPIEDAVFAIEDGVFTAVGTRATVDIPTGANRVDLTGKTVIPAFVNAHVHLSSDPVERSEQLKRYAHFGQGLVVSLGLDEGDLGLAMRDQVVSGGARALSAGRGITTPEPGRSEVPHWVTTPEEARAAVQELATQQVDIIKIWVDDRGGQYERMSPELYGAVIDEAHQHGLQVTAHIFRLEDAKGLLRAGVDAFAHGIRDQDVDDELVALWQDRPDVVLVPNLPGPGIPFGVEWLEGELPADEMEAARTQATRENPRAQEAYGIQARNLVRLNEAGVKIAFGTDGSSPWAVHLELEDMVRAGMSPAEVMVAATRGAAELMGVSEVGTIEVGKSADFVALNGNPLDDITSTRRIHSVTIGGEQVR